MGFSVSQNVLRRMADSKRTTTKQSHLTYIRLVTGTTVLKQIQIFLYVCNQGMHLCRIQERSMWRGNFHSISACRGLPFQRYWQSRQPWSWEIRPCGSKGRKLISMIDGEPLHPRRRPMIIKLSPLPRDDFHMSQGKDNASLWRGGWETCHQSLNKIRVS